MTTGTMTRSAVTHHTVEVNGIRMHYVTAGAGEPVLLVHGSPQTGYAWRKVIPSLAVRYRVIAPDLRGCGDTDRPYAAFDKQVAAEDLHQLVQQLGVGPVNLIGHDVAEYALRLGAPGALRCGLGYFRSHKTDAEYNRKRASTKLAMRVLTVGASLSFKDILAERTPEVAEHVRSIVIPECGHYLAEEQPEKLTAALMSFLGEPI